MYHSDLAKASLGDRKAELVFKHAKVIQVLTKEVIDADIAVEDGIIVGVGQYDGVTEIDLHHQYVSPGFIDAHLHLESTLVEPTQLVHCAGRCGTTTFIVDPHEAANVAGLDGIDYILDQTKDSMANVYVMMPSCVPSAEFEDNGHTIRAKEMSAYVNNPRILGLGEVMDCQAVLEGRQPMLDKLNLFQKKVLDGHAGYLTEKQTGCYALAGISTDHECCTYEDALRELRQGLYVLVREGTAAKNLKAIMTGVIDAKIPCNRIAFCTDDKHIEDIMKNGHISNNIRQTIALGLDVIEAYRIATLYPAQCYGLKKEGIIAPGYEANLVVLSELENVSVKAVYYKGKLLPDELALSSHKISPTLTDTVHVAVSGPKEFEIRLQGKHANVMEVIPGEILTNRSYEIVDTVDQIFVPNERLQKVAVLERHHATGKIGLGIVKGFHLQNGAIASTVGHDSHNLIVIGDCDEDMYQAVCELIQCGGGYTVVEHDKKPMTLPLEIMGLMSTKPYDKVKEVLANMIQKAHELGVPETLDPFITLSFLALPVIPNLRITTRGIYDVKEARFLNLEA